MLGARVPRVQGGYPLLARLAPDGKTGTRWQDWHPMARLAPGGKAGTRLPLREPAGHTVDEARLLVLERPALQGAPPGLGLGRQVLAGRGFQRLMRPVPQGRVLLPFEQEDQGLDALRRAV